MSTSVRTTWLVIIGSVPAQAELLARRDSLNPAEIARQIQTIQDRLTALAKAPTLQLQAAVAQALPDTSKGIRTRKARRPVHGHSYVRHLGLPIHYLGEAASADTRTLPTHAADAVPGQDVFMTVGRS